jgi:hypothetical protein
MNSITLSVYDIFAYAVPGAMYLTLITYVFTRLSWIDPARVLSGNTTLVVLGAALACYVAGHASYALGRILQHGVRIWKKDMDDAREEFSRRLPAAKDRAFLRADRPTLQAAIEVNGTGAALEVIRLRAISLMLRNVVPALILGAIVSMVEAIHGDSPAFAISCFIILLLSATGSFWHASRMSHWANLKTLEVAYWVPGIDENLQCRSSNSPLT